MLNRPYNFFFLLLFNQPILYSKFSSLHRMERIACTYEDIRLDQLEAGIEREGNYTVRRSNLSRSIDDASSNKLVAHSSRILFFLSFRSIDFFPTRLPSLHSVLRYEISSSLYNFVSVFRDRPTLANAKFHYFSLEKGWPEIYGISASAPASG